MSEAGQRRSGRQRNRSQNIRHIRRRQPAGGHVLPTAIDDTIAQCEALDDETERLQAAARQARAAYRRGEFT